jgi:hypothetical protein
MYTNDVGTYTCICVLSLVLHMSEKVTSCYGSVSVYFVHVRGLVMAFKSQYI